MLKFEFIQPGEFEDPYYNVIHEDGDSLGSLDYHKLWRYAPDNYYYSSRILDQISAKLKQLNGVK